MREAERSPERSLRRRYWLLFAGAAAVSVVLFAVIGRLITRPVADGDARTGALLVVWSLVGLVLAVSAGAWWLLYRAAFRDVFRFADELWIVAHGDAGTRASFVTSPLLGPLAEAAHLVVDRLATLRRELDRSAAASAIRVEGEKVRLEAILRDLTEAVIVCDLDSRVLLYNDAALLVLASGDLGLGRSLFNVVSREPIAHTLEMLRERLAAGRRDDVRADFIGSTVVGRRFLRTHMRLVLEHDGQCRSYVLALGDATQELEDVRQRDRLLTATTDGFRAPLASALAAAETLTAYREMPLEQRRRFDDVIASELRELHGRLEGAIAAHGALMTRGWPLFDIHSGDFIAGVGRRLEEQGIALAAVGAPLWLRGESLSLGHAIEALARLLHREVGVTRLDAVVESDGAQVYLDLEWQGRPLRPATVEAWLHERLAEVPGTVTLGDVIHRHDSELWSEARGPDRARLRFPVPGPARPQAATRERLPPRPIFYDFDLLRRLEVSLPLGRRPLTELDFVVLDVETTGLAPTGGDEIVSVAGVRVLNGRVLPAESFARTVNPGIPIPPSSTVFHGITDEMVRDKPPIEVVLRQFHAFCGDAVLVAHNAAFDLKFITLKQAAAGVEFTQAVLDTQLLTMAIGGEWLDRSLDGIAQRLGVTVRARHTALGDAMTTSELLVRMLPLLAAAGVVTLDDGLEVCRRQVRLASGEATGPARGPGR
jgi:DNA polymerase-3 subunit epsilon